MKVWISIFLSGSITASSESGSELHGQRKALQPFFSAYDAKRFINEDLPVPGPPFIIYARHSPSGR